MDLETRIPKQVRDRAEEITQAYRGPKGPGPEKMQRAKKRLAQQQDEHPDRIVNFNTLPEAARFILGETPAKSEGSGYSILALPETGYCAVKGNANVTESVWAGRRIVVHGSDLTREILETLTGDATDEIEEV